MRAYLEEFLCQNSYETEDIATLLCAYDRVVASPAAKQALDRALSLYEKDVTTPYEALSPCIEEMAEQSGVHPYTTGLLTFLCMTRHAERAFLEKGYSRALFLDTMQDLRYQVAQCKAVKGVCGSFALSWLCGFFRLERFQLGRLQFELISFGKHYEKNGHTLTPDSTVINVHIPRTGTPLRPAEVTAACEQAREFYRDRLGDSPAFACFSWLLWPKNAQIFSPESNIMRFAHRFDVFDSGIWGKDEDLWRLFDTDERNPDRLPADSSARRAYIAHLKAGGRTGWGHGVFFLD